MSKIPASINKILEVDMDTGRLDFQLKIRQVAAIETFDRERQPDPTINIKDDLVIFVNALLATILKAEKDGIEKPGECMRKVIEKLQEGYVDASAEILDFEMDEKGNKINP